MKYEVTLKVKSHANSSFEQIGKIIVSPEHLKAQEDAYKFRVQNRMHVFDFVILVNELTDDGEFVRCLK